MVLAKPAVRLGVVLVSQLLTVAVEYIRATGSLAASATRVAGVPPGGGVKGVVKLSCGPDQVAGGLEAPDCGSRQYTVALVDPESGAVVAAA